MAKASFEERVSRANRGAAVPTEAAGAEPPPRWRCRFSRNTPLPYRESEAAQAPAISVEMIVWPDRDKYVPVADSARSEQDERRAFQQQPMSIRETQVWEAEQDWGK